MNAPNNRREKPAVFTFNAGLKIILMLVVTASIIFSGPSGCTVLTVYLLTIALISRIGFTGIVKSLLFFLVMAVLILLSRSINSSYGFRRGLTEAWRFLLIAFSGIIVVKTTDPADMRDGLYLILRRLPFINSRIIAVMTGLVLRFIPRIFHLYGEIRDTAAVRGVFIRRNSVRRVGSLGLPLFRNIIRDAYDTADALETRCDMDAYTPAIGKIPVPEIGIFILLLVPPAALTVALMVCSM